MSRIITTITVLEKLKTEALEAAKQGQYPGANSFSSMVEIALDQLLHKTRQNMEAEA